MAQHPSLIALNSGSSSLKFTIFRPEATALAMILSGEAEAICTARSRFWAKNSSGKSLAYEEATLSNQQAAAERHSGQDARPACHRHKRSWPGRFYFGLRVIPNSG